MAIINDIPPAGAPVNSAMNRALAMPEGSWQRVMAEKLQAQQAALQAKLQAAAAARGPDPRQAQIDAAFAASRSAVQTAAAANAARRAEFSQWSAQNPDAVNAYREALAAHAADPTGTAPVPQLIPNFQASQPVPRDVQLAQKAAFDATRAADPRVMAHEAKVNGMQAAAKARNPHGFGRTPGHIMRGHGRQAAMQPAAPATPVDPAITAGNAPGNGTIGVAPQIPPSALPNQAGQLPPPQKTVGGPGIINSANKG